MSPTWRRVACVEDAADTHLTRLEDGHEPPRMRRAPMGMDVALPSCSNAVSSRDRNASSVSAADRATAVATRNHGCDMIQPLEWKHGYPGATPGTGEIHVWRSSLALDAAPRQRLSSHLSSDEAARAGRFRFERDRNRFVSARGVLRVILAFYLDTSPAQITFCYGDKNKPALADARTGLCFNLSHSGDWAIYAVGSNRNIGIDIEQVRDDIDVEGIATRFFSPKELGRLLAFPLERRTMEFFCSWVRTEAYIKVGGGSLSAPFPLFDSHAGGLSASSPDGQQSRQLISFTALPGYPAALAYDGSTADLSFFQFESSHC
jgi:4'-phosphopantetheinyl transferase